MMPPEKSVPPQALSFAARQLAAGLTLVPYRAEINGVKVISCAWVKLRPGESVEEAARRLSNAPAGRCYKAPPPAGAATRKTPPAANNALPAANMQKPPPWRAGADSCTGSD